MTRPRPPEPVKLICGVLTSDRKRWRNVEALLCERFSPVEDRTPWGLFDFTHYYDGEMGSPLWRCFLSFRELLAPDLLAESKLTTNEIETYLAAHHPGRKRFVNLDPGWLTPGQLVLASTKPAAHRIYLREGIYAELELLYRQARWHPLPWTYPDYRTPDARLFFSQVRRRYLEQRKSWPAVNRRSAD